MLTALIAVIDTSGLEPLDAVDQQHRIAMRQCRHHPPDIERADGGACRSLVHWRVSGPGGWLLRLGRGRRADAGQRRIERGQNIVGDVECRREAKRRAGVHQDVRATALHRRLQQRDQLGVDLLADIGLVALDLGLLPLKLLSRSGFLLLEGLDPLTKSRIGLLAGKRCDRGLQLLALGLELGGQLLPPSVEAQ